jgi:hypothetical protein
VLAMIASPVSDERVGTVERDMWSIATHPWADWPVRSAR